MTINITIEQLIDLAKHAEYKNPIEWGELPVDENQIYTAFAKAMYAAYINSDHATKDLVLLASLVKIQTENFALGQYNKLLLNTIAELKKDKG